MYVSRQKLANAVRESQALGRVTDDLAVLVLQVARGYCERYWPRDHEDVVQSVALIVVQSLGKIRADGNVFSFLTTCTANEVYKRHRVQFREDAGLHRIYDANSTYPHGHQRRAGLVEGPR